MASKGARVPALSGLNLTLRPVKAWAELGRERLWLRAVSLLPSRPLSFPGQRTPPRVRLAGHESLASPAGIPALYLALTQMINQNGYSSASYCTSTAAGPLCWSAAHQSSASISSGPGPSVFYRVGTDVKGGLPAWEGACQCVAAAPETHEPGGVV